MLYPLFHYPVLFLFSVFLSNVLKIIYLLYLAHIHKIHI